MTVSLPVNVIAAAAFLFQVVVNRYKNQHARTSGDPQRQNVW